jgi:hypothetical protein
LPKSRYRLHRLGNCNRHDGKAATFRFVRLMRQACHSQSVSTRRATPPQYITCVARMSSRCEQRIKSRQTEKDFVVKGPARTLYNDMFRQDSDACVRTYVRYACVGCLCQ